MGIQTFPIWILTIGMETSWLDESNNAFKTFITAVDIHDCTVAKREIRSRRGGWAAVCCTRRIRSDQSENGIDG